MKIGNFTEQDIKDFVTQKMDKNGRMPFFHEAFEAALNDHHLDMFGVSFPHDERLAAATIAKDFCNSFKK